MFGQDNESSIGDEERKSSCDGVLGVGETRAGFDDAAWWEEVVLSSRAVTGQAGQQQQDQRGRCECEGLEIKGERQRREKSAKGEEEEITVRIRQVWAVHQPSLFVFLVA